MTEQASLISRCKMLRVDYFIPKKKRKRGAYIVEIEDLSLCESVDEKRFAE